MLAKAANPVPIRNRLDGSGAGTVCALWLNEWVCGPEEKLALVEKLARSNVPPVKTVSANAGTETTSNTTRRQDVRFNGAI